MVGFSRVRRGRFLRSGCSSSSSEVSLLGALCIKSLMAGGRFVIGMTHVVGGACTVEPDANLYFANVQDSAVWFSCSCMDDKSQSGRRVLFCLVDGLALPQSHSPPVFLSSARGLRRPPQFTSVLKGASRLMELGR